MATSPDIANYQIPTGKVYFTDANTSVGEVDLGNCVNFSITNEVTTKDHFRSYGGRRTKDKTIITQVGATIKFTLDEITVDNVALFALGDISGGSAGGGTVSGLSKTEFTGTLRIVGDNDVGPKLSWEGVVSLTPAADFFFIQDNDNWNQIQVTANVEEDSALGFGLWSVSDV